MGVPRKLTAWSCNPHGMGNVGDTVFSGNFISCDPHRMGSCGVLNNSPKTLSKALQSPWNGELGCLYFFGEFYFTQSPQNGDCTIPRKLLVTIQVIILFKLVVAIPFACPCFVYLEPDP